MSLRYLDIEGVSLINREVIALSAEQYNILQPSNLSYCVEAAKDIIGDQDGSLEICVQVAAFYIWCMGSGHIFTAGNKRTAYQVAYVFLLANGYRLVEVTPTDIVPLMTGITLGTVTKQNVENWIRKYIKPISS